MGCAFSNAGTGLLCLSWALGAAADFSVAVTTYPAGGTLAKEPSHTSISNYGNKPLVLLNGNPDNSYDVAWHLSGTSKIRIQPFDSAGKPLAALQPDSITGAKNLVGLARIADDNGFAIGYAKDSPHSGSAYEFWVTRVDGTGQKVFTKMIFGDMKSNVFNSKGEPGTFSSGRMIYNKASKKIALYVGHTMAWSPDTVRHQAGYLAFMGLDGAFAAVNDWYSSHNFDQRIFLVGSDYYTLAHGDAYPRALGFAKWTDAGAKGSQVFDKQFFKIPGGVGDNKTSTQLGNAIPFADGTFGVMFTTANGREGWDVAYRQLGAKGDTLSLNWITAYPKGTQAIYPKMAKHGDNVLLMWEEIVGTVNVGIQLAMVSPAGAVVMAKTALPDKAIRLSPYYDLTALPNGKILWANQKGTDSISVIRLVESGSPVRGRLAAKAAPMRLAYSGGRLVLSVRKEGRYTLRRFDSRGMQLSRVTRDFQPGDHPIAAPAGKVSFVEAAIGDAVQRIALAP